MFMFENSDVVGGVGGGSMVVVGLIVEVVSVSLLCVMVSVVGTSILGGVIHMTPFPLSPL